MNHLHTYVIHDLTLGQHLRDGYVREQSHPTEPLRILNYSAKTQYENVWDEVTTKCRGLIYNADTMEIVARPFQKFFNWGQVERDMLPKGRIRVQDKADGSLGVLYREPSTGMLAIASRGSFTSDQATHATDVLRTRYSAFAPLDEVTYLFEIIYPENRIVVDYGSMDDLILLDILDNKSGTSLIDFHWARSTWKGPVIDRFEYIGVEDVLSAPPREGKEGFVITYDNGFRIKVKQEEYVRLHRLLTNVSNKAIWEILSSGGDISEILDNVPDEYYRWVHGVVGDLHAHHLRIKSDTTRDFHVYMFGVPHTLDGNERRKNFAQAVAEHPYRGLLFMKYDDKDIDSAVWKLIKPTYEKPFWNRTEDAA